MIRSAIAAAALALSASAAQATTTEITPGNLRGIQIAYSQGVGQSFVATGTELNSFGFEFQTFNPGRFNSPVTLTLRSGAGLTGSVITSRTMTLPTQPNYPNNAWFDFDFTGTALTAGQTYTAELTTSSALLGLIYGPDVNIYTGVPLGGDAYAGGQIYANNGIATNCANDHSICDANFRFTTTGSATAAVPEPASWAMMLGGFGLMGTAMRRRRSVRFA